MKIVIAPDSYKESLTAMGVAQAIENGFKQVLPEAEYIKLPMQMAARERCSLSLMQRVVLSFLSQ